MNRHQIIERVGSKYLTTNIENDEFSYAQALQKKISGHKNVDIRFQKDNLSLLIEIKKDNYIKFSNESISQIESYIKLEREYKKENNIIAILYNTKNDTIICYKNDVNNVLKKETTINDIDYYLELFKQKRMNSKINVINTTNELNIKLHSLQIDEKFRSQFVGTLLVALNNDNNNKLKYSYNLTTKEILDRIKDILRNKLEKDDAIFTKTKLLIRILDEQHIANLKTEDLISILELIKDKLMPYIDSTSSKGDDLLNLFFTTFNKYTGKADKNQAFTPTHITDFMCELVEINTNSRVLDPTCGSGSFLVQAMHKMLNKARNDNIKKQQIKREQIYGIESEHKAYGLAITNMLIHEDGKSNIVLGSCFDKSKWIKDNDINVILMNPPYNGKNMPSDCPVKNNTLEDGTQGLYFVKYVADIVNKGKLATILPLSCAIGTSFTKTESPIRKYKRKMLKNHTLKAVFSLPDDIFYPGASVNTCIMLFELGIPHDPNKPTFFGYYKNDGFIKRKNKGRVEKTSWKKTKAKWLYLFNNLREEAGLSVRRCVNYEDEWLAEAYMETDYSQLTEQNFVSTIRDYIAFKVKNGDGYDK